MVPVGRKSKSIEHRQGLRGSPDSYKSSYKNIAKNERKKKKEKISHSQGYNAKKSPNGDRKVLT